MNWHNKHIPIPTGRFNCLSNNCLSKLHPIASITIIIADVEVAETAVFATPAKGLASTKVIDVFIEELFSNMLKKCVLFSIVA